ncbi:MAG: hypothetical protein HC897_06055 [Thermoanaerobaculia bacterium]|nr:hypothetical protein [Thermoanaerobaculia bacterium]
MLAGLLWASRLGLLLGSGEGRRTGVLLDIQAWESLVEWIENATDARAAARALTELTVAGSAREAGWVDWEDVREEWAGEQPER